ncbi:hypothetical protein HU200_032668 [Digitaria exilis]|uniref:Beta-fructofuranosidase n=1 Tax=Digitaria exilis TaxID=1010633 RepID=A0A835BN28_9POAL|nr:hypothetical protein HU200_032668 [Digitaria exilis]
MIVPVADPTIMDDAATRAPLLPETDPRSGAPTAAGTQRRRPSSTVIPAVVSAVLLLAVAAPHVKGDVVAAVAAGGAVEVASSRGAAEGVSEKSTAPLLGAGYAWLREYSWTNAMLAWQRTAFHFQPTKNWMNGPLYHKGWYHLFYQWNPDSAVWGNITWGHAVSRDLVHWLHLPLAMVPDHWYDANGVWSGSATRLPDGRIVMLYTGSTKDSVQVQNLAEPADPSDPLLREWVKSPSNPVLVPPPGIGLKDFRDPTTAWQVPNDTATWRVAIGSKDRAHAGLALVYRTKDFVRYDPTPAVMHVVPGTGMWECVDFYPVAAAAGEHQNGLDTSAPPGPGVKHVVKASLDDDKHDYYAIGTYDAATDTWTPDDAAKDVGIGLRYDYGKFYASKTFYEPVLRRRVLWGWVGETDSERADILKGWASVQSQATTQIKGPARISWRPIGRARTDDTSAMPAGAAVTCFSDWMRAAAMVGLKLAVAATTVLLDTKTGTNLLQWPVVEVENLRMSGKSFDTIKLDSGSVVPLDVGKATQLIVHVRVGIVGLLQLDIEAVFEVDAAAVEAVKEAEVGFNCSTSAGAAGRGMLGPFGLLVLADEHLSEQTAVYFYLAKGTDGSLKTFFCQDDLSFAQGGRTCITAIYDAARVFLFNNATNARVTAKSVKIWQLNSAYIRPRSRCWSIETVACPAVDARRVVHTPHPAGTIDRRDSSDAAGKHVDRPIPFHACNDASNRIGAGGEYVRRVRPVASGHMRANQHATEGGNRERVQARPRRVTGGGEAG